ncbi:hypothetical protein ACFFOM_08820 [Microlunatus capsulatus]|uniref:Uncharacterized protein n=1 Tax=Microlunatus capsulatus TaxID=99117 RepID=A0ABS4ZAT1_9ACTN|nr:hypothetical protein [Microlunatus capsulatus]MBP2418164.1 hypothetical protein [Microlunatus capsulatus]
MTSSPYVPSEGQNQFDEPVTTWEPAGTTEAGTDIYAPSTGQSSTASSTKDTAKDEAAGLKDTAVDRGQQVAGVAKEQAGAVKDTAVASGQHVAETAKEQVAAVTSEASGQFRDLLHQSRTELTSQAGAQQQRLGSLVHSFAEELGSMASSSDKSGPLTDLAKQGSRRVGEIAHRIENSEPSDLLADVRDFARRRPGVFLGASLLAGVVVGRLTRSLAAEAKDAKEAQQAPAVGSGYGDTGYSTTTPGQGYSTTTPAAGYDAGSYTAGGLETGSYTTGTAGAAGTTGYEAGSTGYEPARAYDDTVSYDDTVTYVEPGQGGTAR